MGRKKQADPKRSIENYEHRDKERVNNPPVGLVSQCTDSDIGQNKKRYAYDPHLAPELYFDAQKTRDDLIGEIERGLAARTLKEAKAVLEKLKSAQSPFLNWAGKAERTSFEVPTVSLHVHERIDPRTIIEAVKKPAPQPSQPSLFEEERKEPLRHAIEFYRHKHGWTNRLIAGDSLLVMNSLLQKENMAGKVQMIYIDPPYGIKYGSNFQPFVNKRDVKDGDDEDLTAEPEQIKAFRDTWELGIHSYLSYLRDRLLLARELLTESGSIFVQIGDENVHYVRCLMDEVFGRENFCGQITFRKTIGQTSQLLAGVADYLLWYCKDKKKVKFNKLLRERRAYEFENAYRFRETRNGSLISSKHGEGEPVQLTTPSSQTGSENSRFDVELFGVIYSPPRSRGWSTNEQGMNRLKMANRLSSINKTLVYKRYLKDADKVRLTLLWDDTMQSTFAPENIYVVQTYSKVVQRCILMTTDPGDLVFDPTCGSGTTAYCAEKWGRRWITCDTSRVAITIAKQRLMTAVFEYYELAHPNEGVSSGFKYKTVPHITLRSIANNQEIERIYAQMHPSIEKALEKLNRALKGKPIKFTVAQGAREGKVVDFAAPDSETHTLPSKQVVRVNELLEWEVPYEFPADWPKGARSAFEQFHNARCKMQRAIDEAIARHAPQETLYDQPLVDDSKARVTGPFTVEAVPAPAVLSVDEILEPRPAPADASIARSGETLRQAEWRDELFKTGIRGKQGQRIRFARLEPLPGCRFLHAIGETLPSNENADSVHTDAPDSTPMRVVVSFGPEYAPLEQRQVEQALEEARTLVPTPQIVVFAAFQFDSEAAKDIDETKWHGVTLLKVQMNADLLTEDLKKKRASNESFWLIGQPDVEILKRDCKYIVKVHGFDYYNTRTGQVESGGADKIAVWMLDTDYDGRCLYPRQVFFPLADKNGGWARLAKSLKAELNGSLIEKYRGTESLPFELGKYKRIAVKIVDDRGVESLKVMDVP
jgi:adenine-specific DNA-methyltransferase